MKRPPVPQNVWPAAYWLLYRTLNNSPETVFQCETEQQAKNVMKAYRYLLREWKRLSKATH